MENLNAEQVKKALERDIRISIGLNYECPRITYSKLRDALALITSQEQRIGAQDMTISELRKRVEKAEHDADRYAQRIKELTEENEGLEGICQSYALQYGTATDKEVFLKKERADTAKKTLDAVRSRATRNAYSCMISGNIRETYTISGKALDEIEKELLEGENEKNTNII